MRKYRIIDELKTNDLYLEGEIADSKVFNKKGNLGTAKRIRRYLQFLFQDLEFAEKRVLDVGAGFGMFSLHFAREGASEVLALEPELDGGSEDMVAMFRSTIDRMQLDSIRIVRKTFQDSTLPDSHYDAVLLHNSVNHLNEEACERLAYDERSREIYEEYFRRIHGAMKRGGMLILSDCTSENYFDKLGMKSPFAPSIEWHKHQEPDVWRSIGEKAGFELKDIRWTPFTALGNILELATKNKYTSRLFLSHFCIRMVKV